MVHPAWEDISISRDEGRPNVELCFPCMLDSIGSIDIELLDRTQALPGKCQVITPLLYPTLVSELSTTRSEQFLPYFLVLSVVSAYTGKVALGALRATRLRSGGAP